MNVYKNKKAELKVEEQKLRRLVYSVGKQKKILNKASGEKKNVERGRLQGMEERLEQQQNIVYNLRNQIQVLKGREKIRLVGLIRSLQQKNVQLKTDAPPVQENPEKHQRMMKAVKDNE